MLKKRLSLCHLLQIRRKHHKEGFQRLFLLQEFHPRVGFLEDQGAVLSQNNASFKNQKKLTSNL